VVTVGLVGVRVRVVLGPELGLVLVAVALGVAAAVPIVEVAFVSKVGVFGWHRVVPARVIGRLDL